LDLFIYKLRTLKTNINIIMEIDKLRNEITSIKKWCKDNDVSIFFGTPDKNNISEVFWESEEVGDLDRYLTAFKNTCGKILIMNFVENDIDYTDEEIYKYEETLDDEEKKEFNDSLKVIQKNKGQIVSYELFFFYNNVSYEFAEYTDWDDEYQTILEAYEVSFPDNDLENDNEEKEIRMSLTKIEELAKQITSNQKYLDAKNLIQRDEITEGLLKQESIVDFHNIYRVKQKVDAIYEVEIKPKREEEIKKKILELKRKNLKKVEIASKLGISAGMVNKFYYTDEN
jgi:hypothetical protein